MIADQATVSGFNPTGMVTFELFDNSTGTGTPLFTATENLVNGVATSAGFTPAATGTDYWVATYSGDANNTSVTSADAAEPVTISAANPTLSTTPSTTAVSLGLNPVTLKDTADLASGYSPTGTITFTLFENGGTTPVDTETATVTGNGTYTTPQGYTLPSNSTAIGTYQWDATYSGDTNNNVVNDTNNSNEQVTVSPGTPTVTAVASNVNASASESFTPSQLFSAAMPQASPILTYEVEDESDGSSQGFWVLNGAVLPNGQITTLTAAQLFAAELRCRLGQHAGIGHPRSRGVGRRRPRRLHHLHGYGGSPRADDGADSHGGERAAGPEPGAGGIEPVFRDRVRQQHDHELRGRGHHHRQRPLDVQWHCRTHQPGHRRDRGAAGATELRHRLWQRHLDGAGQ